MEAREVATRIGAESEEENDNDATVGDRTGRLPVGKRRTSSKDPMMQLRNYFDEYAGEGHSKDHGGGKRTVEHGDVVKALEALLRPKGRSQTAQAIDLAIVTAQVDLYEVKTSARITDVYTGVGQLFIHGECISELLDLLICRHLVVLPAPPRASHGKHVTKNGGINIVTYQKSGAGYKFSCLV